jgi:hypothetical protein
VTLSKEDKCIVKDMTKVRNILKKCGARLCGYEPGVTAYIIKNPKARGNGAFSEPLNFEHTEWQWLRPLLEELIELRKLKK